MDGFSVGAEAFPVDEGTLALGVVGVVVAEVDIVAAFDEGWAVGEHFDGDGVGYDEVAFCGVKDELVGTSQGHGVNIA